MGLLKYIYQDINNKSSRFSDIIEVDTIFDCYKTCPPTPVIRNWLPMLHYWNDDEALSWSTDDEEYFKWPTPMFYNITGREVYIDWGDGSEIEKTSAVVVKHNYQGQGTYTPLISFDENEQPDYLFYSNLNIIAPVLCNYDDTILDWPSRYKYFGSNKDIWSLVIDNDALNNCKPLYIFPNDEDCETEWRYFIEPDQEYFTVHTLYMSNDKTTLNNRPFFAYKPGTIRTPFTSSTIYNKKRDNTCLLVDGTGKTNPSSIVYDSYGEVLTYNYGKQFKFKNCNDVIEKYNDSVRFKVFINSNVVLGSGLGIKIYYEGSGGLSEIFNDTVTENIIVLDELLDYRDEYYITVFLDSSTDSEDKELSCELLFDDVTGKITGIEINRTWI